MSECKPLITAEGSCREAGDWRLEKEIGSGSFAKVWKATHKHTQQAAAVKEINMEKLNKKLQESLASEVAVLNHTKHKNIVGLLDLIRDNNRLFIVLEYCAGGDLGHYIKRYRQVSEATARYFLQQLAEGLKELRRHNVIHRDLKPQNLLLSDSSSTPLLKIADFGFARSLAPQGLAETLCGSPLYMAPEILQFHKYDAKADLWSIGTILFELLVGKPPFNGANHMQLLRNIERNEARLPDHIAARLTGPCRSLLGRLLQRNPVERLTFEEFFQHPFLAGEPGAGTPAGVPPSQPTGHTATAAAAALPPAIRQAVAAVAAAAAAEPGSKNVTGSSIPRPDLHLTARHHHYHHQQQQQQQQPAPSVVVRPWRASEPQQSQVQHHLQLQQHQAGRPQLVAQPVAQHPLMAAEAQGPGTAVEALSDSMEDDFVVVYNPTAAPRSSSNSSKASSGLVDPKAAAVLQGTAAASAAAPQAVACAAPFTLGWAQPGLACPSAPQPQRHPGPQLAMVEHGRLGQPYAAIASPLQQQLGGHQHQQPSVVPLSAKLQPSADNSGANSNVRSFGPTEPSWPWLTATAAVGCPSAPADSVMVPLQLPIQQTAGQRMQLLVQVVRGCTSLLTRHQLEGHDAALQPAHHNQQVALMLMAVHLLHVLCLPPDSGASDAAGQQQQQQQEATAQGAALEPAGQSSLPALLAAASQADLEQLLSGAAELLRLASVMLPVLAGGSEGDKGGAGCDPSGAGPSAGGGGGDGGPMGQLSQSLFDAPLPDPVGVLYHQILDICRGAAVEEVMGNWQASLSGYSLAADLLLFLSQDWPELGPANPGLSPHECLFMHKLYTAVSSRLAAVVADAPSAVLY